MVFAFGKPTCTTGVVGNLSPTLTAGTPRLIFTTHTDDTAKKFLLPRRPECHVSEFDSVR